MATDRQVKPGEKLQFARALQERGLWPPPRKHPPPKIPKEPVTAFIVMPAQTGDSGTRPFADTSWINSPSLGLLNVATQQLENAPRKGVAYQVVANIQNAGAAPLLSGFAEFYVADPIRFDNALGFNIGSPQNIQYAWLGVTPFSLGIQETRPVQSRRTWTPTTDEDLMAALLVRAFDPLADKATSKWDSWGDRHVARRNLAPNFAGTWTGLETHDRLHGLKSSRVRIRIDAIAGVPHSTPLGSGGSYPSGDFECTVTVQEMHGFPARAVTLLPANAPYRAGRVEWIGYSTNSADPQATKTIVTLTQQTDGNLHMTCRWGPNQLSTVADSSHATLKP